MLLWPTVPNFFYEAKMYECKFLFKDFFSCFFFLSVAWFLFRLLHMMFCVAFTSYIVLFSVLFLHLNAMKAIKSFVRWYVNEIEIMWWVSNKQQLLIIFVFIDFHSRNNFYCLLSKIFFEEELCWSYKRCNLEFF